MRPHTHPCRSALRTRSAAAPLFRAELLRTSFSRKRLSSNLQAVDATLPSWPDAGGKAAEAVRTPAHGVPIFQGEQHVVENSRFAAGAVTRRRVHCAGLPRCDGHRAR